LFNGPLPTFRQKFHANPLGRLCAKLLTDKQTNNDENISSLAEFTKWKNVHQYFINQLKRCMNDADLCFPAHIMSGGIFMEQILPNDSKTLKSSPEPQLVFERTIQHTQQYI